MSTKFGFSWNEVLKGFMWGGLLVLGFNYFFPSGKGNPDLKARIDLSGQMFKAPVSRLEVMPLAKEIDFVDDHKAGFGQDVIVQTPLCDYAFSTDGAILSGITYKKHIFSVIFIVSCDLYHLNNAIGFV